MRILQVVLAYYPATAYGGPVRSVRNLCRGLSDLGHECTVCTTDCDGVRNIDVPCGIPVQVDQSTVYYFHSPRWHYYGFSPDMKVWLKENIANYDIVHINGIWSFPQRYAAKAARQHNVPYLISPRGSADRRLVREYLTLAKWLYIHVVDRANLRSAAAMHYATEAEREYSVLSDVCRSSIVVANASEFEMLQRHSEIPSDNRYILFVGRLSWKKQVDVLIQAFADIVVRYPELRLFVVGPDDEGLGPQFARLVQDLGIEDRVEFTGHMQGDGLIDLYRNAKLFVSASLSENFGHTIAESLAAGVPVVASRNIDITTFPQVGSIVRLCHPVRKDVAEAMGDVLENYEMWRKAAADGPAVVRQLFSVSSVATAMSQAYDAVVRGVLPDDRASEVQS